jgi:hypothetical protein
MNTLAYEAFNCLWGGEGAGGGKGGGGPVWTHGRGGGSGCCCHTTITTQGIGRLFLYNEGVEMDVWQ